MTRYSIRKDKLINHIFVICCICSLALSGCGETEDNYTVTKDDVEEFLSAEDDYEGNGSGATEDEEPGTGDSADSNMDLSTDPSAGVSGGAVADASDDNGLSGDAENTEDKELFIGNLTKEEYDALTLEEQDALRDAERKKVTPPYESSILPEYRELYDYNNAVIGYIYIDGTTIEGPVLQTLADYEYYLHRDIDGALSEPGCIILDADSEIGIGTREKGYLEGYEPSTIQLVHGHNMRNGTMFGSLLKYANSSYADSHSIIDYDSIYEKRTYEVVCAFYSQIYPEDSTEFKYYNWNQIDSEAEFNEWWTNISDMALYKRDVDIHYGDEIIVLSTCAYQVEDGRFAVVGVRKPGDSSLRSE